MFMIAPGREISLALLIETRLQRLALQYLPTAMLDQLTPFWPGSFAMGAILKGN